MNKKLFPTQRCTRLARNPRQPFFQAEGGPMLVGESHIYIYIYTYIYVYVIRLPMQQLADAAALYFQPNAAVAGRPNGGAAAAW